MDAEQVKLRIKEYFERNAVSQSKLKKLISTPKEYLEEYKAEEKRHFVLGSAVDVLFMVKVCNLPESIYTEQFYTFPALEAKPSDALKGVLKDFLVVLNSSGKNLSDWNTVECEDYLIEVLDRHEYGLSYKRATRLNKVYELYHYWEALCLAGDRIVLSQNEASTVEKAVKRLIESPKVRETLKLEDNHFLLTPQFPIYFEYMENQCKGLCDFVVEDTRTGDVVIVDLKTTADSVVNFPNSCKKFRYDIQAAYYCVGGMATCLNVKGFEFIVVSLEEEEEAPAIFKASENFLNKGLEGDSYNEGVNQLFKRLATHKELNDFSLPVEFLTEQKIMLA